MKPSFNAHVIHCESMNPKGLPSAKTGKVWSLFKVHCVIDLAEQGKRVVQLVNNDPVQPGPVRIVVGLAERDGRAVFMPEAFEPVAVGK